MNILGIMSGTSMDGVDLALCSINQQNGIYQWEIVKGVTIPYEETWRVRLAQLRYQNAEVFAKTDIFYGRYLGELINHFLQNNGLTADLIASHGHTIFHDPNGWNTTQIGDAATMNAVCGIPVVANFRRGDVALGGHGAPLAGIGDELLFGEFPVCLNLGGFCNVSGKIDGKRVAFDISPCNIILNRLAREKDQKFDTDGLIADGGEINFDLLNDLNGIDYYFKNPPKSLGREWINENFWHLVRDYDFETIENKMKTLVMHIATQVSQALDKFGVQKVLTTGGGAYNNVLIEFIKQETQSDIVVPENNIIDYKEALIFALLGYMRVNNIPNNQPDATGAKQHWVLGGMYGAFSKN